MIINNDEKKKIVEEAVSDIREIFDRVYEIGAEDGYSEGYITAEKECECDKESWKKQILNDSETVFESLENSYREIRRSPTDFNRLIDLLNVLSDGKIGLIKK